MSVPQLPPRESVQNSDAGNTLSHNVRAGGKRDAVDCDGRDRRQTTRPCQNKIDSLLMPDKSN